MADYKLPIITGTALSVGDILRWNGTAWVNYADSNFQAQGDVLDDLNTLGANAADGDFLVGTGAGALAWETGNTARTSLGLGTGDSPTFAGLTVDTNTISVDSVHHRLGVGVTAPLGTFHCYGNNPRFMFGDSGSPVNEKLWDFFFAGSGLYLRTAQDDGTAGFNMIRFQRSSSVVHAYTDLYASNSPILQINSGGGRFEGTCFLKEQAAANADQAAYGQIWVKNTTPCELFFTDDAGNDIQCAAKVKKDLWLNTKALKAPTTKPATLVDYGIGAAWAFSDGTDDTLEARVKLPNSMDKSAGVEVLIGWNAEAGSAGNAKWDVEYLFRQEDEAMDAAADATLTDTVAASGTAKGLVVSSVGTTVVPNANDVCLTLRIKRRADEAADTISADIHLFGVCLIYTSNKRGEAI